MSSPSSLPASNPSSGSATPRARLDTLPHGDLIRYVKKQLLNVKQAKEQIKALEEKLLESPVEQLQSQVSRLKEENASLRAGSELANQSSTEAKNCSACVQSLSLTDSLQSQLAERVSEVDVLRQKVADFEKNESTVRKHWEHKCEEECQLLRKALNERGEICDELHEENERLTQELLVATRSTSDMSQNTETLKVRLEEIEKENELLKTSLETKTISFAQIEDKLATSIEEVELCKREMAEFQLVRKDLEMQLTEWQQKTSDCHSAILSLETSYSDAQATIESLKEKNNSLNEKLIIAQRNEGIDKEIQTELLFDEQQAENEKIETELRTQIECLQCEKNDLAAEKCSLERDVTDMQQKMAASLLSLEEQNVCLTSEKNDAIAAKAMLDDEIYTLREKVAAAETLEASLRNAQNELEMTRTRLSEMEIQLNAALIEKETVGEKLNEMESRCSETLNKASNTDIENELLLAMNELNDVKKQKEHIESAHESLEKQVADMQQNVNDSHSRIDSLESSVSNMQDIETELRTKIECLEKEKNDLLAEKATLESEMGNMREMMSASVTNLETVETKLKEKVVRLKREKTDLISDKSVLDDEIFALQEKVAIITTLETSLENAENELELLKTRVSEMEIDLSAALAEKGNLHERLKEMESQCVQSFDKESNTDSDQNEAIQNELRGKIETLEIEKNDLIEDKSLLDIEFCEMRDKANTLQSSLTCAENELDLVKGRLSEMEIQLSDTMIEKEGLIGKMKEMEKESMESNADQNDKQISIVLGELSTCQYKVQEYERQLENMKRTQESQTLVIDQLSGNLEHRLTESEQHKMDGDKYKKELDQLKEAKMEQYVYLQNMSTQNVLSLEMADYEKSLKHMQDQLNHFQSLADSKTNENESVQRELEAIRDQKSKSDGNVNKLKAACVKLKRECAQAKETSETREHELKEIEEKLRITTDEMENLKMEVSSSMGVGQQRVNHLETALHSLQRQLTNAQHQRDVTVQELTAVKEDFETYKVRVHSVLKQQQTKSNEDEWAEEKKRLSSTIDDLQQRLSENNITCRASQEELIAIQDECDRLNQRLKESEITSEHSRLNFSKQLEQLKLDYQHRITLQKEVANRLSSELTALELTYKNRITSLESDYNEQLINLRQQLTSAESQLQLRSRNSSTLVVSQNDDSSSDHEPVTVPLPFSERKPAEGSESTDYARIHMQSPTPLDVKRNKLKLIIPEPLSPASMPLEDLLNSDQMSVTSSVTSPTSTVDQLEMASSGLDRAMRRVEHITEVLNESEGTNIKMTEQTKILKHEIRRLERNQEREKHLANCEYLKNVILKFIMSNAGDQKVRLVPVLATMLKLSPEETEFLNSIASGKEYSGTGSSGGGWSSYFHRWSGLT